MQNVKTLCEARFEDNGDDKETCTRAVHKHVQACLGPEIDSYVKARLRWYTCSNRKVIWRKHFLAYASKACGGLLYGVWRCGFETDSTWHLKQSNMLRTVQRMYNQWPGVIVVVEALELELA